jgi:PAS domain-containing protein
VVLCLFSILSTICIGFLSAFSTEASLTGELNLYYPTLARHFSLGYMKPRTAKMRTAEFVSTLSSVPISALEQLFDQVHDVAFFIKDHHGRYVAVNHSLLVRHGLSSKLDAIGKRPLDICSGDFGKIPAEQDRRVLETGMPIIDHLEMQWEMPGRPVWCLTTKVPLKDDAGEVIGAVGFSTAL